MKLNILDKSSDFFRLFFPEYCLNCNAIAGLGKLPLCLKCNLDLPLTDFSNWNRNRLERSFSGRIQLEAATALLYYSRKGTVSKLIRELKYNGNQNIGLYFGHWLGEEMKKSQRFDDIDMIVPVPLHALKERKRGYNQVHTFARGLEEKMEVISNNHLLIKNLDNTSQTFKSRDERNRDQSPFFLTETQGLNGKHVLLVDDIITSGATMVACANAFELVSHVRFSLASIAFTE